MPLNNMAESQLLRDLIPRSAHRWCSRFAAGALIPRHPTPLYTDV